jgi:hypothetical protein
MPSHLYPLLAKCESLAQRIVHEWGWWTGLVQGNASREDAVGWQRVGYKLQACRLAGCLDLSTPFSAFWARFARDVATSLL